MPDCTPGQIDGQCGLGSFLQIVYSFAGALLVWPIASLLLVFGVFRRPESNNRDTGRG